MNRGKRPVLAYWPRLFFFTFLLVLLRPQDPLPYFLFLPGFFLPLAGRGATRPLYLWLGWSFFSALCAPGFPASMRIWAAESLVAGAGFAAGLYGRRDRRWLPAMAIMGLLMGGMILVQAAAAPPFPRGWVSPAERGVVPFRVTGLWPNPNLTGLFLAYLLPLFLAGAEEEKRKPGGGKARGEPAGKGRARAVFFMALAGLTAAALLFTYARTAWVAALAALFAYWGPRERIKRRRLAVLLLILVGLFPSVAGRLGRIPSAGGTVGYRFAVWQETWRLVQKYPLTGGGQNELRAALKPLRVDHAHNLYLQIAAEKGIPALPLLGWLLWRFWKTARRPGSAGRDDRLRRGIAAAFGGQLVAGLTESTWAVPLGSFLFWFAFALVTAGRDEPGPVGAGERAEPV